MLLVFPIRWKFSCSLSLSLSLSSLTLNLWFSRWTTFLRYLCFSLLFNFFPLCVYMWLFCILVDWNHCLYVNQSFSMTGILKVMILLFGLVFSALCWIWHSVLWWWIYSLRCFYLWVPVKLNLLGNTHLGFKNYLQLDGLYISTTLGLCGFLHW